MHCLNDFISERRGNTISTFELPRAIPLWAIETKWCQFEDQALPESSWKVDKHVAAR